MKEIKLMSEYLHDLATYLEQNENQDKVLGEHLSKITNYEHLHNLDIEFKTTDKGLQINFITKDEE